MSSEVKNQSHGTSGSNQGDPSTINRRDVLLGSSSLVAAATLTSEALAQGQWPAPGPMASSQQAGGGRPNILFIMGDDIGWFNVSAYNMGIMGYRTPNIDLSLIHI